MSNKDHFLKIVNFLRPYEGIWNNEIINFYPNSLDNYKDEWLEDLKSLSDKQLWQVDSASDFNLLNSDLNKIFKEIWKLSELPKAKYKIPNIPLKNFHKVKAKKRHEILQILGLLKNDNNLSEFETIVDIGGGVGHLARKLSMNLNKKTYSIDRDSSFQSIGKEKNKDNSLLSFINHNFSEIANPNNVFNDRAFSIGLHTCGPLANIHLKNSIKYNVAGMLNFGCCYMKLHEKNDINISNYAIRNGLNFHPHTLSLATRSHSTFSFEDFLFKKRVKYYRFGLHLLLYHLLGTKEFCAVGDGTTELYNGSFSNYVLDKLDTLKISHTLNENQIESFYNEISESGLLEKCLLANIIRWKFGRLIEHYILFDRAIFLEENGKEPRIMELFDENISPRNICILY